MAAGPARQVGRVTALARYPVKSMAGERLDRVDVASRGLVGDRAWAAYTADGGIGSGKTTRRFRKVPGLLDLGARLGADDVPWLEIDGVERRVDDPETSAALSERLGQPLALRPEGAVPHHDESPIHLVTTSARRALERSHGGAVDEGRFRANVVLETDGDGYVEHEWVGRDLAIGEVVLRVGPGMPRCVMVDLAHGGAGLPAAPGLLRTIGRVNGLDLGVQASVVRGGVLRLGDSAFVC
ncbi:MOSC domain-containing protein [Nocardioides terrisoli]|uniref:MOSC domain-containing protein n=1 Tax=Nocardioides terrisoli TaxID=3388267 RepID=UPI00287B6270|nr:MOSC N-terminal beta barrel domain-containing protein [Nocardioides marmorisolisilvae]